MPAGSVIPLPDDPREFQALCLGLNAWDHLLLLDGFPARGGKTRFRQITNSGGGQAATAACALARLGHRVAYAGVAGDDPAGRRAAPLLRDFGVDPSGLVIKPGLASQEAFILVEPDGERTIIWKRDEELVLKPEDLKPELIARAKVLHLDGHFLEASLEAAAIAKKAGVVVSLDGERFYPGSEKLLPLCDVLMGCQDFPQRVTGIDHPEKALAELGKTGPAWVGRTLGEKGAVLLAGGQCFRHPGFRVKAVDTTGAGDVFHAGMVHAVLLGQGPQQALATANALAAISTTQMGGRAALPDRAGLVAFLARHG